MFKIGRILNFYVALLCLFKGRPCIFTYQMAEHCHTELTRLGKIWQAPKLEDRPGVWKLISDSIKHFRPNQIAEIPFPDDRTFESFLVKMEAQKKKGTLALFAFDL